MTKQMTAAFDVAKDGSKRTVGMFAVLAAALALVLAMAAPASAQTTVEGADGNVWSPDSITVEAGTTVTFDMTGGDFGHNGYLDGTEIFGLIPVGESTTYTFNEVGDFTLVCTIHPGMEMSVSVTEAAGNGGDTNGEDTNGEDTNGDTDGEDTNGDTDGEDTNGDTDGEDADGDVEQPSEVASGSGGLVQNGFPMWVAALMALGALALFAPAVVARRRS